MEYLDVYLHDRKVGTLSSDKGKMEFSYSAEYIQPMFLLNRMQALPLLN